MLQGLEEICKLQSGQMGPNHYLNQPQHVTEVTEKINSLNKNHKKSQTHAQTSNTDSNGHRYSINRSLLILLKREGG